MGSESIVSRLLASHQRFVPRISFASIISTFFSLIYSYARVTLLSIMLQMTGINSRYLISYSYNRIQSGCFDSLEKQFRFP